MQDTDCFRCFAAQIAHLTDLFGNGVKHGKTQFDGRLIVCAVPEPHAFLRLRHPDDRIVETVDDDIVGLVLINAGKGAFQRSLPADAVVHCIPQAAVGFPTAPDCNCCCHHFRLSAFVGGVNRQIAAFFFAALVFRKDPHFAVCVDGVSAFFVILCVIQ
ncbi:unknown [Clostridium sp. CAG:448]|nr:unknown [Clostridium sp. CAG:448]